MDIWPVKHFVPVIKGYTNTIELPKVFPKRTKWRLIL